ncbi:MAG: dihydropteroate synthase [Bacteroidales bacterium]
MNSKPHYINVRGKLLDLSVPRVMGIINVTPDSFYKQSRFATDDAVLNAAKKMISEGADILDIGGYSSRPGAEKISAAEEKNRVLPAIKLINREFPEAIISIDTFRSEIAAEAILDCGASLINDISGGEADAKMFDTIVRLRVPYIIMHMKGEPSSMQLKPVYDDVVAEILKWLGERIVKLQLMGVSDIIIDPGFGFGKTAEHNFELLRCLGDFRIAGLPVLVGLSRKSTIWKTLGITPEQSLNGTTVLNTVALLHGTDILRVHDVKEAVEAIRLIDRLMRPKSETGSKEWAQL